MKKTLNNGFLMLLLILQAVACQKKPVVVPPVEKETCQITRMTFKYGVNGNPVTAVFKYNNLANPVSMIVSGVSTGNPHALFLYDEYNRLKDFISTYGGNTDPDNLESRFFYEYAVTYVYADQNPSSMPVSDTFRQVGIYNNGKYEVPAFQKIEPITYDAQGRIVRENGYDANGNLILPNVTYDNKKNYRQTNKIWMLVDKNYSKNNGFIATAYNGAGYPTTFPEPVQIFNYFGSLDNFLLKGRNFLTMEYSCSIPSAQ